MRARIRSRSPMPQTTRRALVPGRFDQGRNRLVTGAQRIAIAQRPMEPAAQGAAAHRGRRGVDDAGERQVRFAGEALIEFEVAPRRRVHDQGPVVLLAGKRAQMRQRHFLRLAHVIEERARRGDGERLVGAAEPGEVARLELFGRVRARRIRRRNATAAAAARAARRRSARAGAATIGHQKLRGPQTLELSLQRIGRRRPP